MRTPRAGACALSFLAASFLLMSGYALPCAYGAPTYVHLFDQTTATLHIWIVPGPGASCSNSECWATASAIGGGIISWPGHSMACSDSDGYSDFNLGSSASAGAGAECGNVAQGEGVLDIWYHGNASIGNCEVLESSLMARDWLALDDAFTETHGGGTMSACGGQWHVMKDGLPTSDYSLWLHCSVRHYSVVIEPERSDGQSTTYVSHIGGLVYIDGTPIDGSQVLTDGPRLDPMDYQQDPNGDWVRDVSWSAVPSGGGAIKVQQFGFRDIDYDVNDDGRFNRLDPNALQGYLDSNDPVVVPKLDINNNGHIDQADVDYLRTLVEYGIHAGVLGDVDGDGELTCTDYELMSPFPLLAQLGDTTYRIELDADLNGILDANDQIAMLFAFGFPTYQDTNCDQIPDICQGACCWREGPYACTMEFFTACENAGGAYQAPGALCTDHACFFVGDVNCDDQIDQDDIPYFGYDEEGWRGLFGGSPPCSYYNNDCNHDGYVDENDWDAFYALLADPPQPWPIPPCP